MTSTISMVVRDTVEHQALQQYICIDMYVLDVVHAKCTDLGGAKELRWAFQGPGDG
jgi:hypothetical protein